MKSVAKWLVGAGLAVASVALAPHAAAGVDISFGASVPLGDDGHLFMNISSRYFDRDVAVVNTWAPRYPNPDDLAVSMWIAQRSGQSPDFIFSLRHRGMGWFDVGARCGIPVDAWYVPVPAERVGPPYGHAYGFWNKHQRDPHYAVRLTDYDVRNLFAVRMAHEYYGVSPETAMGWRQHGESIQTIMTHQYHERHAHPDAHAEHHRGDDQGEDEHGHGHGHGHDKGHGHGND